MTVGALPGLSLLSIPVKEVVFLRAMQQWLERFCRKHPRLGIPGLMKYIVIGNILVFILDMFGVGGVYAASNLLSFNSSGILHGEVWRLVTFIFVPYVSARTMSGFFWLAVMLYFYYFIGTTLEREWGTTKFTVFYVFGIILNIIVGFIVGGATMNYVNLSMFFAFATLFPDMQVLLFFIIPVKVKWLAWVDAAFFAYTIIRMLISGHPLLALLPMVAILNYLLFFAVDIGDTLSYWKRRAGFKTGGGAGPKVINFNKAKSKTKPGAKEAFLHKCAVCGKTDVSDPAMEFRYCSRCNGYYCYCADHINSHIHIQ